MNKFALTLLITACAPAVYARMSIHEGRTRVVQAQAQQDGIAEQIRKLDEEIQRATNVLSNINSSPESAGKINALNRKLKRLIQQERPELEEQYRKAVDGVQRAVKEVGPKHYIDSSNGKFSVIETPRPRRSAKY